MVADGGDEAAESGDRRIFDIDTIRYNGYRSRYAACALDEDDTDRCP
jgi:hypothetical protein